MAVSSVSRWKHFTNLIPNGIIMANNCDRNNEVWG